MLSELRKYRLNLILAHQFLGQLEEPVRDAILGNIGTFIAFRLGPNDAEMLEKEFYPEVAANDLVNLPNFNFYIKLMIDGTVSKPFSGKNMDHLNNCQKDGRQREIIQEGSRTVHNRSGIDENREYDSAAKMRNKNRQ